MRYSLNLARQLFATIIGLLLVICSCNDDNGLGPNLKIVTDLQVDKNPSGAAPLTAQLSITTNTEASVRIRVIGKNGENSDIIHDFPEFGTSFEIPVLGLYPAYENQVELSFLDGTGTIISTEQVAIQTDPLNANMPQIRIDVSNSGSIKPGLNLVNYFGHNGDFLPQRPLMFDEFGDIRWYLNFSGHPILSRLFYDNGMNLLQNGNLVCGDGNTGALYEINMLGEIVNTWSLQGFGFHHHVIEKPNGNLLVTVNDNSIPTTEDLILEIDRASGDIVDRWDLNASLDNSRKAWPTDLADLNIDWFHANAVEYSPSDNGLVVSGRTQGTVKLTEDNQVVWILAPYRDWNTSGDGTDLSQLLLKPLDNQGAPITDIQVLEGEVNHPDFEWAWYQHSPILLPNGNLMVFDNGDNRNYSGSGGYSRAVEYEIDEENMTVKQVWSYGKERGGETYSRIVSKVVYHADEGNVLFTPGAVAFGGESYGKVIEVDQQSGQVLFEATVIPPTAPFNISFHNVQRITLYN